jgi:prophage antirepressor-like protein|nr:MAG TPA: repressor domain protein [Bacteriophage sp.]
MELQIFSNTEFGEIRTITKDDEPMFCLGDVCRALELTQPSKVKERLNSKGVNSIPTLTKGGEQKLLYINESNLYKTIFQSRKDSAERFTDWVTSEVLPSIRKTGGYNKPMTTSEQIKLLAQGNTELSERMDRLENDMPLYGCEIDEIQSHVKRKAVNILGGKQSNAYKDASTRNKVFSDMWNQLKREYGCVSTYKSIKRKYIADVHDFIDCYELPRILEEEVHDCNAQLRMELRD